MTGLLGFLMRVWIIVGFYLYTIYYSVVISTISQAWKQQICLQLAGYYKSSLQSQPVVLIQYEKYMGSASLCQRQVLEHIAVCTFEGLSHVQVAIAAVLEGSVPKFHLGNLCVISDTY